MNPIQTNRPTHIVLPSSGEHVGPQAGASVQPTTAALPNSVQVGDLTLQVGRVIATLSDIEAQLLHGALHPKTPKETFVHSPDKDGVYSYVIGAKDYFESLHLPRPLPERMMVTCKLDSSLNLKNVLISELKGGKVYCVAHFEPPVRAKQIPASQQAASLAAGQPLRTNLSVVANSDLTPELIQSGSSQGAYLQPNPGASQRTPGPHRPHADQNSRHNPYPLLSGHSGASTRPTGASSQALSPAESKKIQKNSSDITLAYVEQHFEELQNRLGRENVIKIAAHHGGAQTFQALLDKGSALNDAGFSDADLVRVAAHSGGAQALPALLEKGQALREAGFSNADLVKVAAHDGGAPALHMLLEKGEALREAGFSNPDLVKVAANGGGTLVLQALLEKGEAMNEAGFSNPDLVKVAAHKGGAQALQLLLEKGPALNAAGFSNADLVKVAGHDGAAQALQVLLEKGPALNAAGFSNPLLVKVAAKNGGAQALQALLEKGPALREEGYNTTDLVKIASSRGGTKILNNHLQAHQKLVAVGVLKEQIVKLVTKPKGAYEALQSKLAELTGAGH